MVHGVRYILVESSEYLVHKVSTRNTKAYLTKCFLCLWFCASLIYINNYPTRCNTKQSIYYSASSLYMFRLSTTPIIRRTQNCNYSLRYCAATSLNVAIWPRWREVAAQYRRL